MVLQSDDDQLKQFLLQADRIQSKLDRSIFHLRTLYEVSKDIYSLIDSERILHNFLMMTMGNFGVIQGFIAVLDTSDNRISHFSSRGIKDGSRSAIRLDCKRICAEREWTDAVPFCDLRHASEDMPCDLGGLFPFAVETGIVGLLGMGPKISGEDYSPQDFELIETLVCNLGGALKNALAFEKIKQLNLELKANNQALAETLEKLKSSLRKNEILEGIKESLSKFVPATVTRLIESHPRDKVFENKRQDITVLFLDIENYTLICNRIGSDEIGKVIEAHFSVFMDAIYANNGDVNETAGDGLMVLFLDADPGTNTRNAVQTALQIREDALKLIDACPVLYKPLTINIGINSGDALVGAAKFDSLTGSRWTYTARGQVVNVAARIGALASKGSIYLSGESAARVKSDVKMHYIGKRHLKNVPEPVAIFAL